MVKIAPSITSDRLFGHSEPMRRLQELIQGVAPADVPVLITGPSGAGKNLVAKAIHLLSPRKKGSFIEVSCVNIPPELLESELFGYEKGAFTGAYQSKPGRVEFVNGGTLFLDEIGDIPLMIQGKLLRLLQEGVFSRLGGYRDMQVDVRIISATNRNLEQMVKEGKFREDLFFRINVIKLEVPSLAERNKEIPILTKLFLKSYSEDYNRPLKPISKKCMDILQEYHWPGNVRELENGIKRLVLLGEKAVITELKEKMQGGKPSELVHDPSSSPVGYDLKKVAKVATERAESLIIRDALEKVKWKKKEAAKLLKISYKALLYKMKRYNITR
jgi:transcriptional regulator with PAS, ATPase and Fis domain